MNTENELANKRCKPIQDGMASLSHVETDKLMKQLEGWQRFDHLIGKTYHFNNYYETITFVNAVAWMSHREDHHPELTVGYNTCHVEYTTHATHGLSENDFICAAKIDTLFKI